MGLFRKPKKEEEIVKTEEALVHDNSVALPKGGDAHSYGVVLSPYVTEKGTMVAVQNKYVFKVAKNANKTEIAKAVESLYKVGVAGVHIAYAPSKHRRVGRYEGRKPGFKKAIVTLREGDKIDIAT
jgi:large subunit ribosomal protein L23